MIEYLNKLVEQFKSATGVKNIDIKSPNFVQEFNEWLKIRMTIAAKYGSFIEDMNVYPHVEDSSVEIGKGRYDSIAPYINVPVITPYGEGMDKISRKMIVAKFFVCNSSPIIIKTTKEGEGIEAVNTEYVRRFITHNPYDYQCINNWEQLHNQGDNITVGIFGSVFDKDIKQKIRQIELLKDNLCDDRYKEECTTEQGNYYYVISSTRKVKRLIKVR